MNPLASDLQAIAWSVLAFSITLHDGGGGGVLTARVLGQTLGPAG